MRAFENRDWGTVTWPLQSALEELPAVAVDIPLGQGVQDVAVSTSL